MVKTNKNGQWTAVGLTNGGWNILIEAEGYAPKQTGAEISEVQMGQLVQTQLDPVAPKQEAPPPAEVKTTPLVPKEAIDAIKEAQDLLRATDNVQDNAKKAVAFWR